MRAWVAALFSQDNDLPGAAVLVLLLQLPLQHVSRRQRFQRHRRCWQFLQSATCGAPALHTASKSYIPPVTGMLAEPHRPQLENSRYCVGQEAVNRHRPLLTSFTCHCELPTRPCPAKSHGIAPAILLLRPLAVHVAATLPRAVKLCRSHPRPRSLASWSWMATTCSLSTTSGTVT